MSRAIKLCLVPLLITALLLSVFAGCEESGGDSFGFTITDEPRQIDPQVANDTASLTVISAVFEGLTRVEEDGTVVPGAADWMVSADGLTYTFKLKTSYWNTVTVRGQETGFEDPVVVTAYDFEFGIRRTADPATASPHASMLRGIKNAEKVLKGEKPLSALGVKATDDNILVITLEKPDDTFLEKLATPGFMPCNSEFFAYTSGRYGLEKQYILTNGAFYVSGWDHDVSVSLRKNEHYHAAAEILPASVKYRVTLDEQEDFELLKKGSLDAAFVPADKLDEAKSAGIQLIGMQDTMQYLWMNNSVPALKNADIRKAISAAIEWEALWNSLPAGYTAQSSFLAPAAIVKGVTQDMQRAYATDPALAVQSLAKGMAALGLETAPTFTVLASEEDGSADVARYILQSFSKNLSIQCALQLVDAETLAARVQAGNYELAVYAVTGKGLTAKENLEIFTSTAASGNYARFSDATYDSMYAAAADDAAAVDKLEAYLFNARPALPIGCYTRYYGLQPNGNGIIVRPFNGGAMGATVSFRQAEITE